MTDSQNNALKEISDVKPPSIKHRKPNFGGVFYGVAFFGGAFLGLYFSSQQNDGFFLSLGFANFASFFDTQMIPTRQLSRN
jgi:hypothetical protein